jgi:transposase InsO family protein
MGVALAAEMAGFSERTGHKWLHRFRTEGERGLRDRSSRPRRLARSREEGQVAEAEGLRRTGLPATRVALALGIPRSTVGAWLRRAGISKAAALQAKEPPRRYEHEHPGDLLHLDTKKLGRIEGVGHRIHGDRTRRRRGIGWEVAHVAIDDHSRLAYVEVLPDEQKGTTADFLKRAVAHFQAQGIEIRKLLTDNGSAYRSKDFRAVREGLGMKHGFTRPYRPRTNGKAERFIQTALREWAYARPFLSSQQRSQAMEAWLHHYNHHRPHSALGGRPPISRANNVSGTDT